MLCIQTRSSIQNGNFLFLNSRRMWKSNDEVCAEAEDNYRAHIISNFNDSLINLNNWDGRMLVADRENALSSLLPRQ